MGTILTPCFLKKKGLIWYPRDSYGTQITQKGPYGSTRLYDPRALCRRLVRGETCPHFGRLFPVLYLSPGTSCPSVSRPCPLFFNHGVKSGLGNTYSVRVLYGRPLVCTTFTPIPYLIHPCLSVSVSQAHCPAMVWNRYILLVQGNQGFSPSLFPTSLGPTFPDLSARPTARLWFGLGIYFWNREIRVFSLLKAYLIGPYLSGSVSQAHCPAMVRTRDILLE